MFDSVLCRCVEILISEQFRRYKEKMQNIQELEYAEALAVNQLKLRRQNTVRGHYKPRLTGFCGQESKINFTLTA